jgi:transcriptional regulator with XRE-family HTH domain
MIVIPNERYAARLLQHLREQLGLTRRDMARRLFVSNVTVANREYGTRGIATDALIDHAHVLGFAVALVPQRHPGARPTGTGWPA